MNGILSPKFLPTPRRRSQSQTPSGEGRAPQSTLIASPSASIEQNASAPFYRSSTPIGSYHSESQMNAQILCNECQSNITNGIRYKCYHCNYYLCLTCLYDPALQARTNHLHASPGVRSATPPGVRSPSPLFTMPPNVPIMSSPPVAYSIPMPQMSYQSSPQWAPQQLMYDSSISNIIYNYSESYAASSTTSTFHQSAVMPSVVYEDVTIPLKQHVASPVPTSPGTPIQLVPSPPATHSSPIFCSDLNSGGFSTPTGENTQQERAYARSPHIHTSTPQSRKVDFHDPIHDYVEKNKSSSSFIMGRSPPPPQLIEPYGYTNADRSPPPTPLTGSVAPSRIVEPPTRDTDDVPVSPSLLRQVVLPVAEPRPISPPPIPREFARDVLTIDHASDITESTADENGSQVGVGDVPDDELDYCPAEQREDGEEFEPSAVPPPAPHPWRRAEDSTSKESNGSYSSRMSSLLSEQEVITTTQEVRSMSSLVQAFPPKGPQPAVRSIQAHGNLKVRLITAVDLFGFGDDDANPYVEMKLGTQTHSSTISWGSQSPVWNEEFMFITEVSNESDKEFVSHQSLVIQVLNKIMGKSHGVLLGHTSIPLRKLVRGQPTEFNLQLSRSESSVNVVLTATDFGDEE